MRQAIGQYAERATEKLRGKQQFCRHIAVFVKTSQFAVHELYYGNVVSEKQLTPMQNTKVIMAEPVLSPLRLWVNEHHDAKASCMLNDFPPTGGSQLNLFDDIQSRGNVSIPAKRTIHF